MLPYTISIVLEDLMRWNSGDKIYARHITQECTQLSGLRLQRPRDSFRKQTWKWQWCTSILLPVPTWGGSHTRGSSLAPAKQCWCLLRFPSAGITPNKSNQLNWIVHRFASCSPSRSIDNLFTGMAPTGAWGRVLLLWPPRERWHAIKSLDVRLLDDTWTAPKKLYIRSWSQCHSGMSFIKALVRFHWFDTVTVSPAINKILACSNLSSHVLILMKQSPTTNRFMISNCCMCQSSWQLNIFEKHEYANLYTHQIVLFVFKLLLFECSRWMIFLC